MIDLISNLSNLPLSCIYILIDKSADNAFLQWSKGNAVNQLANTITALRRGIHDNTLLQHAFNRGNLSLELLKTYDTPPEDIIIRADAILLFQQTGLLDMTGKYNDKEYRLETVVNADYRVLKRERPLVYVTLRTKSVGAIVLGVFDTMLEADFWMELVYPGLVVNSLKYCDNSLTIGYHKTNGYKMLQSKKVNSLDCFLE